MLISDVLILLLKKGVYFTSGDFVRDYRSDRFSALDVELVGLWFVRFVKTGSESLRTFSTCSPKFILPSKSGQVILFAWPLEAACWINYIIVNSDEK